jgi:phasin protein
MPDDTKTIGRPAALEMTNGWSTTCTALLDGNQQALTQWVETMQGISEEISRLAATRLQLVMESWSALAACRSPEEVIDWNRRMTARMTEHCSGEIVKVSQMTMRIAVRPTDSHANRSP